MAEKEPLGPKEIYRNQLHSDDVYQEAYQTKTPEGLIKRPSIDLSNIGIKKGASLSGLTELSAKANG